MANMVDYLAWRGDIPFAAAPWNELDGLLTASVSYLDFNGGRDPRGWTIEEMQRIGLLQDNPDSPSFPSRKQAFEGMAAGERFRGCRIHHAIGMTDEEIKIQFSAMCIDLPDGTTCIAFRGTDNTIVGWQEDFNMAFTARVPAQEAAVVYLARAAELPELSGRKLRVTGHSKGGNLAVYASACASEAIQERIESIWVYDAPGMNREMAQDEGYLRIKGRVHSFIPQTSIIGLLMDYYDPYTVVYSTATGMSQHDPSSWQVYGPRFETKPEVDQTAKVVRDTLHDWMENSTPEQRGAFVDALFQLVETTKATKVSELTGEKLKTMMKMIGNRKEVNPEARRVFTRLMAQAISLGFGNVIEMVRSRKDDNGNDTAEAVLPESADETAETTGSEGGKKQTRGTNKETPGATNTLDK